MTDRDDITRQVEELLGSEGSHELAELMVGRLIEVGGIEFDAQIGYERAESFPAEFERALDASIGPTR